jgi:hypothetical protein
MASSTYSILLRRAPMSKLPRDLLAGGSSVAVYPPLRADAVAHRYAITRRENKGRVIGSNQPSQVSVSVPACDPKGPAALLFTAAWADHMGAVACTEPDCFPDA